MEEGKFPNVFVAYLVVPCYHCEAPVCMDRCPEDAIRKREEDGIVMVDREVCLGESNCGAGVTKNVVFRLFRSSPCLKLMII